MANQAQERCDLQRESKNDVMSGRMVGALDNLANAAVNKNTLLKTLVATNKTLTDKFARMSRTIAALSLRSTPSNNNGDGGGSRNGDNRGGAGKQSWHPDRYCRLHGYKVCCSHSSVTCEHRKDNHYAHVAAKRGDIQV